jgi:hypothetical protein
MAGSNNTKHYVQPSGSDDPDDLAVTPYTDQFLAGYDPARIFLRPQWPSSGSSLQSRVHLLSSATAVRSPQPIRSIKHQGHVRELEKAKRCLAPLLGCLRLRTLIHRQVRCAPFRPFGFVFEASQISCGRPPASPLPQYLPPGAEPLQRRSFSLISSSPAVLLALASKQDKVPSNT